MKQLLLLLVRSYRLLFSPWLGSGCRFEPTCSLYAMQALALHGAWSGGYLTVRRIFKCNPWCQGGHDPVPTKI
jgi:putative membrane protein insertion efficiency factor